MKFTVVYKTYKNDLKWLKYSLLSLQKYVSGISELIIYYHDECELDLINLMNELDLKLKTKLIPVTYDMNGYIKQMVVKCMCFEDVDTEFIMYMDSDVIFSDYYSPESIIEEDKIKWFIQTRNEYNYNADFWLVWEKSVEKMTNDKMTRFYMSNEFPFILKKESVKNAYNKFIEIHGVNYDTFCKNLLELNGVDINDKILDKFGIMATIFEEFEYLGWYSYNFTNDYIFIEGRNPKEFKNQFWSHGGLTEEIEMKIKKMI
jgi:hypothetical protein